MAFERLLVFRGGCSVEEFELQRTVLDAVAQHIDDAAARNLPLESGEKLLPRHVLLVLVVADPQLGVFLRLGCLEKCEQLGDIDRVFPIVVSRSASEPATAPFVGRFFSNDRGAFREQAIGARQVLHDEALKALFAGVGGTHIVEELVSFVVGFRPKCQLLAHSELLS